MPFITLTSRFTDQPTRVRPDAITAIVNLDEKPGAFVHVGFSGWAVSVTESPETILAAIADAERGEADVLEDAIDLAEAKQAMAEGGARSLADVLAEIEITDEMLHAAVQAHEKCGYSSYECMHDALIAALKARRP